MKTTTFAALALAATLPSSNATPIIDLYEFAFNIDGNVTNGSAPSGVNLAGFSTTTGLGTISVTLTGIGNHNVLLFLDHEIDEVANTFFNEFGTVEGSPASGQSWEIDEPGWVFGDIYDNFEADTLDNSNGVPTTKPDDVSMAIGWNLTLDLWQTATVYFTLSESAPASGFYLTQSDVVNPQTGQVGGQVYFSSDVRVTGSPPGVPDGGSTLALLLCACGGLAGWRAVFKFFS